jgi:hypothetical protein
MSDFNSVAPSSAKPHPDKRVRYSLGLVLGEDDLAQEQYYFLQRDRLHARRLHGYGTVCGLEVTESNGTVTVEEGLAVDRHGRVIRVTPRQCGDLAAWLARQAPASPPLATVYVALCYRECESDRVPIPGTACRTAEENAAASRITESFELHFLDAPPSQLEEAQSGLHHHPEADRVPAARGRPGALFPSALLQGLRSAADRPPLFRARLLPAGRRAGAGVPR